MTATETKTTQKAVRSALRHGGLPENYEALHNWFYEPMEWVDGEAYLIFRHHTQGIFEAEKRFGVVIRTSDGKQIPTRLIAEQHVESEIGFIPTALELLDRMQMQKWMGYRNCAIIDMSKKK